VRRTRWSTALAVGVTATFVLAACGSSKKATSTTAASATTAAAAATTAAAAATTAAGSTATTSGASTATTSGGSTATTSGSTTAGSGAPGTTVSPKDIGLINGVYKGTGGFSLDTKKICPSDWNPTQGISASEIDLFQSLPSAGAFAGFGIIADGERSYFKVINDAGGIDGRKIVLDSKDDGYQPAQTKTNVDEALGANKYAALDGILGSANGLAVWDEANDDCMPNLLNESGIANWGDVQGHPWTTGMQLDYFTEASLWATWLTKEHPELKTVSEITYNNDFGQAYHSGFNFASKGTDLKVVDQETHEATAPNLTNQFTTLASKKSDVLLIETSGAFCTQAMAEVEKEATWHPLVIMSSTCGSLNQFFQPLIDQGLTGKDTYLIQYFKDPLDPANANDPFIAQYYKETAAQGLDPKQTTYFTGWIYAWVMVDILKNAATYQGGLDRGNIMLAARNVHETNPALLPGLTSITNGEQDAYFSEGGQMAKYTVTDPKKLGTFVKSGDLINLEGQLGTFKTVKDASAAAGASTATTAAAAATTTKTT
jgi:branched-chain amino acid transport system substrate-binding protein